jgi:16S rRNA (cytidine1402-2'-O)-methyltransferase
MIPVAISPGTSDKFLTEQMKNIIRSLDMFFVEDIRTARRFISSLNLGVDIPSLEFTVLDKRSNLESLRKEMSIIKSGRDIGVMSEAGCPGVADPGTLAVKVAHEYGAKVVPLVGPSSFLLALMSSGLSGQSFVFHGYLPKSPEERVRKVRDIDRAAQKSSQTQIFMETPYRNTHMFQDILQHCSQWASLCVAVDITGENEFIKTKTVAEWRKDSIDFKKFPTVFLIGYPDDAV